jgi:hypothetical protein
VLIPIAEALGLSDTVTISTQTGPYLWGASEPTQKVEGGEMYGSFGYGSFALGSGLPYADDTPSGAETRWGFSTWS